MLLGTGVFTLLGALAAPLFGFSFNDVLYGNTAHNVDMMYYLLIVQNMGMFLLPVFVTLRLMRLQPASYLGFSKGASLAVVGYVVLLSLVIQPLCSFSAMLNGQLQMPEWMVQMENSATALTERLLLTPYWEYLLLNILVVAAIPAFVEELFFRGFLQSLLQRWIKKPHLAIVLTAFVFSAFHLQFLSFLPRFILGALLGYLFYWSGSLWLPMVSHFVNNLLGVCAYFYISYEGIPFNIEQMDAALQGNGYAVALSVIVSGWLIIRIKNIVSKKSAPIE
ncbi:hypothetical protein FACS1894156_1570 [Bacteroidia bacterium]|nr:hypothetical protein FACS1894156_1570 [Bacteroidia bacterium]